MENIEKYYDYKKIIIKKIIIPVHLLVSGWNLNPEGQSVGFCDLWQIKLPCILMQIWPSSEQTPGIETHSSMSENS